jgi:hypothetical protein
LGTPSAKERGIIGKAHITPLKKGGEGGFKLEQQSSRQVEQKSEQQTNRAVGDSGNVNIFLPLWKRGIEGDLKKKMLFFIIIKSPLAPLCQRGELKKRTAPTGCLIIGWTAKEGK